MSDPADPKVATGGMPNVTGGTGTIGLVEEIATIGTRTTVTGRVRVQTATEMTEEVGTRDLHGIEASVIRVKIDRMLDPGEPVPTLREEGDTLIVPIFEEVAVTEIRLVLKEELHLTQRATTETVDIRVALRKQTATIERTGPGDDPETP